MPWMQVRKLREIYKKSVTYDPSDDVSQMDISQIHCPLASDQSIQLRYKLQVQVPEYAMKSQVMMAQT